MRQSPNTDWHHAKRTLEDTREIPKGVIITHDHLTWKRPAHGISPKEVESLLGKRASINIKEDQVLQWKLFD